MDRLREQLRVIDLLRDDLVSAADVKTIILHARELIPKYAKVELVAL
jgi:hypothetical protein